MTTTAAGIVSTTVSTAAAGALAPLGFELEEPAESGGDTRTGQGPRIWVYVQNDAAAATAWTAGKIIQRLAGASTHLGMLTAAAAVVPPARILGVTQHAIPSGSFGFILKRGIGSITPGNGAALAVDTAITSGGAVTAGTGLDALANASAITDTTNEVIGWCTVTALAGPLTNATCWIDCSGG
jgi:hypothetical protein